MTINLSGAMSESSRRGAARRSALVARTAFSAPPIRRTFEQRRGADEGGCRRSPVSCRRRARRAGERCETAGERQSTSPAGVGHCVAMATLPLDPPHVERFEPSSDLAALRDQRIRAVVWLTLIFWVSNYLLLTLATALAGNVHLKQIVLVRFGEVVLGIGVSFLFHLMLRSPWLSTTRRRLIALAIVTPIAAEIFAWA